MQENKIMNLERDRQPRWATRQEAMAYARMGATRFNGLMQERKIVAKKMAARSSSISIRLTIFTRHCRMSLTTENSLKNPPVRAGFSRDWRWLREDRPYNHTSPPVRFRPIPPALVSKGHFDNDVCIEV
ncbi:hypothetical protein ACFIOY_21365 [Bradyrhizobium sp. TZ2]